MKTDKTDYESLEYMLVQLAKARKAEAAAIEEREAAQSVLVNAMKAKKRRTASVVLPEDRGTINGTLIEAQRIVYDETKLKAKVGRTVWTKITKLVLDKEKLEAAVSLELVDPIILAECSTVTDNKPYVRVTGTFSLTEEDQEEV